MSKSHKNVPAAPGPGAHHDEDEVVHVPKGQSKLRFLLTLGLMLFVLVIFTVGDQLMGTFGSGPSRDGDYMTWVHPDDGVQGLGYPDFVTAKRAVDDFFSVQGQRAPRDLTEDDHISYLLITDRLAREAGIVIPKQELARAVIEGAPPILPTGFINKEIYLQRLRGADVSPKQFEDTLSWLLRVSEYERMVAYALATPDTAAVEASWKEQHQQYAFDMAGTSREEFLAAADLESPDDATLADWYAALTDQEKGRLFADHYNPERIAAALVYWAPGSALPTALLERFPAPEGSDPALAARSHYDLYRQVRYLRPAPEEGDEPLEGDLASQLYLPYEEVEGTAADEAAVVTALRALLADLRARRAAGEQFDLQALAAELGLEYSSDGLPRSQDEWVAGFDMQLAPSLRRPGPGGLVGQPVVGTTRLWLADVLERLPSSPPEFAAIPAEVRTAWSRRRAAEMAGEALDAVYASLVESAGLTPAEGEELPPSVQADAEAFAAALAEAGITPVNVDWFDPARVDVAAELDPAPSFLSNNFIAGFGGPLYDLAADTVMAPMTAMDGERVWLVRSRGQRDPEQVDMRPAEYDQLLKTAHYSNFSDVYRQLTDVAARFDVRYPGRAEEDV